VDGDSRQQHDVSEALASAQERRAVGLAGITNQVELLGGRLDIDSGIGRGARITFELPTG